MNYWLLIFLFICHYLADFCLTTPSMIKAKADGKNPLPIILHSLAHAILMGICLLMFAVGWQLVVLLMALEMATHFLIDTSKGLITSHFKFLSDNSRKPYWILYGSDQLLHQTVIIIIWMIAQ